MHLERRPSGCGGVIRGARVSRKREPRVAAPTGPGQGSEATHQCPRADSRQTLGGSSDLLNLSKTLAMYWVTSSFDKSPAKRPALPDPPTVSVTRIGASVDVCLSYAWEKKRRRGKTITKVGGRGRLDSGVRGYSANSRHERSRPELYAHGHGGRWKRERKRRNKHPKNGREIFFGMR